MLLASREARHGQQAAGASSASLQRLRRHAVEQRLHVSSAACALPEVGLAPAAANSGWDIATHTPPRSASARVRAPAKRERQLAQPRQPAAAAVATASGAGIKELPSALRNGARITDAAVVATPAELPDHAVSLKGRLGGGQITPTGDGSEAARSLLATAAFSDARRAEHACSARRVRGGGAQRRHRDLCSSAEPAA
jgi:hypothetical protein